MRPNRIALIVLDSTIEIAFKESLVNDSGAHYTDTQLIGIFASRHKVHAEIQKFVVLDAVAWRKVKHHCDMRNNLIHSDRRLRSATQTCKTSGPWSRQS